jgi:uncharacterized protein
VSTRPLVELGLGAAWLVGLAAAVQILDQIIGPANLGAAIFGAMGVDIAAARAGVRWDEDTLPLDAPRRAAARVAVGAAVAVGVAGLAIAVAGAFHWFQVEGTVPVSAALAFALARAAAVSVRDELLFRGIPLAAAARAGIPAPVARVFAALVSGASLVLVPGVTAGAIALAVASGWLFASLWSRDRGAWAAVGAHAAWMLVTGSVMHGGALEVTWTTGELTVGASAAGPPAWTAALLLVAAGVGVRWLPGLGPPSAADPA